MTDTSRTRFDLVIVATDPPFAAGDGVLFGLQSGRDVDDPRPACATTEFHTTIDVVETGDGAVDFAGEHVHGRRGERFIYLSWGLADSTAPFVMFARAKIELDDIRDDLRDLLAVTTEGDRVLIARLDATNAKGQPASGAIRPPAVDWSGPI